MRKTLEETKWLLNQKLYVIALVITAACGYGYAIVTPIIGIDDTAVELYFRDGLAVAVGCYESFLILYVLGIIMVLFLRGIMGQDKLTIIYTTKYLSIGALLTLGVVILRTVMVELLIVIFGLQDLVPGMKMIHKRGLTDIFNVTQQSEGTIENLKMLIKRYWVVYSVNAIVYLPIASYMFSAVVLGVSSVIAAIRKKSFCVNMLLSGNECITFSKLHKEFL